MNKLIKMPSAKKKRTFRFVYIVEDTLYRFFIVLKSLS